MVLQELSTRETDVIWLIVDGQGNKQIAVSLKLKESTVLPFQGTSEGVYGT